MSPLRQRDPHNKVETENTWVSRADCWWRERENIPVARENIRR